MSSRANKTSFQSVPENFDESKNVVIHLFVGATKIRGIQTKRDTVEQILGRSPSRRKCLLTKRAPSYEQSSLNGKNLQILWIRENIQDICIQEGKLINMVVDVGTHSQSQPCNGG